MDMRAPGSPQLAPVADPVSAPDSVARHLARREDNFLLLRIIAAVAVIYGHSFSIALADGSQDVFLANGWGIYSGQIAVDIFFVISGFMVSGSFVARGDLCHYLKARLLRIVPAYLVVLVVCAFVLGYAFTTLPSSAYFSDPSTSAYVLKNLKFSSNMAWTLPGVFEDHRLQVINGSLWTLPAEMRMYLFVAALGVFGLLRPSLFATLAIAALGILGIVKPSLFALHQEWFRVAGFFLIGILVQLNKQRIQVAHSIMLMLVFITYISAKTASYPYLFAASVAYFCFWFAYRTPCWRWLNRHGDPSYGTYLWGWPMQQMVVHALPAAAPLQNFVLSAAGALVLGHVSWRLVEQPALRLKDVEWGTLGSRMSRRAKR